KGCKNAVLSSSGVPQLGNPLYQNKITGTSGGLFAFSIGASRLNFGTIPLPWDLGAIFPALAGCNWESSGTLFLSGTLGSAATILPLPVPMSISLDGVALWNQAIVFVGGSPSQTTNGLAVGLGQ